MLNLNLKKKEEITENSDVTQVEHKPKKQKRQQNSQQEKEIEKQEKK